MIKGLLLVIIAVAMWGLMVLGFIHLAITPACAAGPKWAGPWPVDVLTVKDGDTIDVKFRDGPCGRGPCAGSIQSVRLRGWDMPEVHRCQSSKGQSCARCDAEYTLGQQAKAFAAKVLAQAAVRVRDVGPDAYNGRVVATIEVLTGGSWRSYGDLAAAAGFAEPYDPDAKGYRKLKGWCG